MATLAVQIRAYSAALITVTLIAGFVAEQGDIMEEGKYRQF
jgi:hypothetical protein